MNPHDRFFRAVFGNPEHAAGELRSVLGEAVAPRFDWSTLTALSVSFVDPELAELQADVLFSVRVSGQSAYVYVLLEHQSSSDRWMPLRLLEYMVRIWSAHVREHPKARHLPPIVPIVLHHSQRGWRAATDFGALFDLADLEGLARFTPRFELVLDDISEARDDQLRGRAMTALGKVALFCLSRARHSTAMIEELRRIRDLLSAAAEAPRGVDAMAMVMSYLLKVADVRPAELRQLMQELGPRAEEAYMTGEQELLEQGRAEGRTEGRAEGRTEGRAEGRTEGRAEGRAELLLRVVERRFGPVSAELAARVRAASEAEIELAVERVLDAREPGELFKS